MKQKFDCHNVHFLLKMTHTLQILYYSFVIICIPKLASLVHMKAIILVNQMPVSVPWNAKFENYIATMLTSTLRIFLIFWNLYSKFSANHMQTDNATKDIQHCIWCILSLRHTHKQTIIL